MRYKIAVLLFAFVLTPMGTTSGQEPHPSVSVNELRKTPLLTEGLTFIIWSLKGICLELKIENTSSKFVTFHADRLSFVGVDKHQVDIVSTPAFCGASSYFSERRIVPGAHIGAVFCLTEKIVLPSSLYYNEKLVAVIHE